MSQDNTEMVTLRDGAEVPKVTAETILMTLKSIYRNPSCPLALYELSMACQDQTYAVFGRTNQELLKELGLVESIQPSGQAEIHDDIRAIVLASIKGEGAAIRLVSPYQA